MRILHVINHTGRLNGNVHAAVDLACAQSLLGHAVRVCHAGGDFEQAFARCSVDSDVLCLDRSPVGLVRAVAALARSMRRWRADIVHAHMSASALLAYPGTRVSRRPLVTTVHNVFDKSADLMRVGDRVIAVSGAVARSMTKRGISERRLRTVLNGTIGSVRFAGDKPPARALQSPSVLFVGGLHPRKGVADLLTAFDAVHARAPQARLYLVGEGPMEMEYRAKAAGLRSHDAITFCGPVDDPRPYLLGADILVLPSLADSAPLVISEAREAGCAVIGTAVDGIPELLEHGKAGLLVPPSAPDHLARAMSLLVEAPQALAHWRACSQINIDQLSIERVAHDTLAVYAEVLASRGASTPEGLGERWRASARERVQS